MKEKFEKRILNLMDRVNHIDLEIQNAIRLSALHKHSVTNEELISKFDGTFAAHGFNISRNSTVFELVMVLMRIWDRGRKVYSIPCCYDVINSDGFMNQLIEYRLEKRASEFEDDSPFKVRELERVKACIEENIEAFNNLKPFVLADDIMRRLKIIRDKHFAHSEKPITDPEKQSFVEFDEVYEIVEWTREIVYHLNLGVTGCFVRYPEIEKEAKDIAESYWAAAVQN